MKELERAHARSAGWFALIVIAIVVGSFVLAALR
jgi:hypothetical protein